MKLISTRMFAGAILAAAVAATPIYTLAQDPPEPPEQPEPREEQDRERQEAERQAQQAQREAQRAQREAQREVYRAVRPAQQAQRAAEEQEVERARARVAPMPAVQGQGPRVFQMRPAIAETKPQTYLGISTRQLTPDVAAHVGEAPEGVGLIVTYLDEEGPAAKAGVKEHDVLVKIDDQWVINPQQLTVLIRMHKAGEEATLTILRKGEEQEVEVELVEKELPVAMVAGNFGGHMELMPMAVPGAPVQPMDIAPLQLEGLQMEGPWFRGENMLDPARQEEIERKVAEAMKQLEEQLQEHQMPELEQHMKELQETLRERELDMNRLQRDLRRPLQSGLSRGGRLIINDEDVTLSMLNEDGEVTIKVSDADGETLYEGEFPDEEQIEELPEEAQDIIEQARKYLPQAPEQVRPPREPREERRERAPAAEEDEDEQQRTRTERVNA